MSQFECEICGDEFEQKSRFESHLATSHPERAPSAADLEKALGGIQYPRTKPELASYASDRVTDGELQKMIAALPDRTYRDAAEVAVALGEVKKQGIKNAEQVAATEPPSVKGGRAAAESVSAAAVAQALAGVDFPKKKDELKEYAKRRTLDAGLNGATEVLDVLDRLQDREYRSMADVERSVGQVL